MEQQLTSKDAEVIWAISRLMKLRRDWVGNWDHINLNGSYYAIVYSEGKICIHEYSVVNAFLTFPTKKDAIEFLKCFENLIEMCKYCIGANINTKNKKL